MGVQNSSVHSVNGSPTLERAQKNHLARVWLALSACSAYLMRQNRFVVSNIFCVPLLWSERGPDDPGYFHHHYPCSEMCSCGKNMYKLRERQKSTSRKWLKDKGELLVSAYVVTYVVSAYSLNNKGFN